MATLSLSTKDAARTKADALVVGVAKGPKGPRLVGADFLPDAFRSALTGGHLEALGVSGAADKVIRVPTAGALGAGVLVLTGLGEQPRRGARLDNETLRRAAGAAVRDLAGLRTVAVALPVEDAEALAAVCEGALFGAYAFNKYRSPGPGTVKPVERLIVSSDSVRGAQARAVAARAQIIAEAVHSTRDLVNTAPVDLFPAAFAQEAVNACLGLPVQVDVLDEKKLLKGGYGGLIAVGSGSARPPRLVQLDYSPANAGAHLALVGKGITFDSGGLSIKPAAGMEAMKSDMSGAAAVLQAVLAVARLELPVRVTGWLALAENMPSGTAQRPSDVITIFGGRTVEVLNTDAEGRLVLADALVAASRTQPDVLVDVATLTGAQMVALGNRTSAIMSNDDELRHRIHSLATTCGEQFWPMPLPAELRASMDSAVADIANMGERFGGMLVAGLFLKEFVGTRDDEAKTPIPWAHLDIAGPAFNQGAPYGYTPAGGTGVAVRTLVSLAQDLTQR